MERFTGKLFDGDRVVFGRVSGAFEHEDALGVRCGTLEAHEGTAVMLRTSRPYRLALDDGRSELIDITGLSQSGTAGITLLTIRAVGRSKRGEPKRSLQMQ